MRTRGDSADYALSKEEAEKVVGKCTNLIERVIIKSQIFLGLRIQELCHLNSSWVSANGTIRIPSSQNCNCYECRTYRNFVWKPKTHAGARTLLLSAPIAADLQIFLQQQPGGLNLTRQSVWEVTKRILIHAGIRRKGLAGNTAFPHALRATFANLLIESGSDAAGLAYAMGWANINVSDRYIRTARAKNLAFEQIQRAFG